jgi:hypothetical protein
MLRRPEPRKSSCPSHSSIASDQETKALSNKRTTAGCSCSSTDGSVAKPLQQKCSLDGYKDIHLTLEVKTFLGNLHLLWVLVWSPAPKSLDFPLITAICIAEKEREITCTQEINKQCLSDYAQQDWPDLTKRPTSRHARLQAGDSHLPTTTNSKHFKKDLAMFEVISILGFANYTKHPIVINQPLY